MPEERICECPEMLFETCGCGLSGSLTVLDPHCPRILKRDVPTLRVPLEGRITEIEIVTWRVRFG